MARQWDYRIDVEENIREVENPNKFRNSQRGYIWVLVRFDVEDETFEASAQPIAASPDVFMSSREAKQDALEKLSIMGSQLENALDKAIKEMLDS